MPVPSKRQEPTPSSKTHAHTQNVIHQEHAASRQLAYIHSWCSLAALILAHAHLALACSASIAQFAALTPAPTHLQALSQLALLLAQGQPDCVQRAPIAQRGPCPHAHQGARLRPCCSLRKGSIGLSTDATASPRAALRFSIDFPPAQPRPRLPPPLPQKLLPLARTSAAPLLLRTS